MEFKNFIGIDISKETVDIALLTTEGEIIDFKWKNDRSILVTKFNEFYKEYNLDLTSTLICAEHTGQYGNKLVDTALQLELNLWMESPYTILHSQGLIRGKNDKVDAIRIAEYAKRFIDKVQLVKPVPKTIQHLKLFTTERDLLLNDLKKYKVQLKEEDEFIEPAYFKGKKKRLKKLIKTLESTIDFIDTKVDEIIAKDANIKNHFDIITSVDGVGKQTAIVTIVATNNFTKFDNPRKFACHIGCAPFRYQSGSSLRSRNKVSQKANKNIKKIYHMAALSTLRTDGELRKYYDRKVDEGKNKPLWTGSP